MDSYFVGKSFLVTGASSGIGRELSRLLAQEGARVAVMARSEDKLHELSAQAGGEMLVAAGDVSRQGDCQQAVGSTVQAFGRLDGLIHNAGVSMRALASRTDPTVYRSLMEVNFFSMVYLYQSALEHLLASKGHLVAVSSMMGHYSTQQRSGYNASKHALRGFINSVRLETALEGLHVMLVSPGFVRTQGSFNALTEDGSPYGIMDQALQKGLEPGRVARHILAGIKRRKREVFPAGAKEKLGLFMSRYTPGLLDRALFKAQIK